MKDNRIKGIIALLIVTIISFAAIYGSRTLIKDNKDGDNASPGEGLIDTEGIDGIRQAWEITDDSGSITGYAVQGSARGFSGPVVLQVEFDLDGKTINKLEVTDQKETVGYGDAMTTEEYLDQFPGKIAPVHLAGDAPLTNPDSGQGTGLVDGTYQVQTEEFDGGYLSLVTLKVEDGKITAVNWDSMDENGEFKSYLSSIGEYLMTEDNPTWKEQADALGEFVVKNQSIQDLVMDEEGKIDTISSVSINVSEFVELMEIALVNASTGQGNLTPVEDAPGSGELSSEIDGISGATGSSQAIRDAINNAQAFIDGYLNK